MTENAPTAAYIRKAARTMEEARILLRAEATEGACSRAYYAMFDAAHAALWAAGARPTGSVIKSHSGLVAAFGEEVVKTGMLAPEWGRALSHALKIRLLADYAGDQPSIEDATKLLRLAEEFVETVKAKFTLGDNA